MSSANQLLLEAKNVTKYFGTITALENVNLKIHAGECLGVVGDNGAGKTTLMKVLSGLYKPSAGSLHFEGKEKVLESPRDSQNLGLEMVYQDLALAGNLPIGENIFLGREPTTNLGLLKFNTFPILNLSSRLVLSINTPNSVALFHIKAPIIGRATPKAKNCTMSVYVTDFIPPKAE